MTDKSSDLFGSISISDDKDSVKSSEQKTAPPKKVQKTPKARKTKSASGTFKLLILVLAILAVYAGVGFFFVPYLVKNNLPDFLGEKLNVSVSINDAQFNPFNFRLTLKGLSVETNEMGEPQTRFLSIAKTTVDFDLLSLLRGDLVCSSMEMDRLLAQITREKSKRYNISYLLNNRNKKNQSGIIDFAELPFLFSLNNIKLSDSQIIFDDKSTSKTHKIESIQLALPAISNFPYQTDTYIHPRFSAIINGSPIKLTGEATLGGTGQDGRQTLLSCDLDDIDIPLYFDYLPVSLPIDVNQGRANGKLQISFSPEEEKGSKLKIQFSLSTTGLALESRNSKLSLKVPTAKFDGSLEPFNQSLAIQSILLREPTLSSDGIITKETLTNLVPLTMRPGPDDPLHQVIPSISIKLLIADGGSVIIKKSGEKNPVRIWHSIQLSIKNFSNSRPAQTNDENSFRLSGEHLSSSAFFTWQGQFDKQNRPGGNLQLNSIDAATIAPFLGRDTKDVQGTADVSGLLSVALQGKGEKPLDFTLKSTRVTVKNLTLKDNGVEWLFVPDLRCEPVSRINNITDLGNVFLKNSRVTLESESLPHLFKRFSERPTQHVIHGIDFSGTIKVSNKKRNIGTLEFTETLLQANRLEQQQINEENFVFSATVNKTGTLTTKGSLHIAPLQISSEIAFSKLKPIEVFSWFSDKKLLRSSQAVLSGQGRFKYPQKEYRGSITADNIIIGDRKKPRFKAAKTRFNELFWSGTGQQLTVKYILTEQPEVAWIRTNVEQNPAAPLSHFLRLLFTPESVVQSSNPIEPVSDFSFEINQIDVNNGIVSYHDNRILPPLALDVTSINGNLNTINFPAQKNDSSFEFTGNLAGQPFTIEGNGQLLQESPSVEATFTAQSLPVKMFSSQITNKLKDINPTSGIISVQSTTQFNSETTSQSSEIEVSGLQPKTSGTPAALALSMLTSSEGLISIELGSRDNEKNILVTELLSNIGTSIIKASINPVLLTGEEYKDLVSNQYVSFSAGSSQLTTESIERLNRFSELLDSRPYVKLLITGYADRLEDYASLLENLEELEINQTAQKNRVLKEKWEKQKKAEAKLIEQQLAAQNSEIKETDIPVNKIPDFVPEVPRQVDVTDTMLQVLALEREKNVIAFLADQLNVAQSRVEQADLKVNRIKSNADYARADISLSDTFSDMIQSNN